MTSQSTHTQGVHQRALTLPALSVAGTFFEGVGENPDLRARARRTDGE
jgi:hypothetical protein